MINDDKSSHYHILDVCPCSFDHADMRKVIEKVCMATVEQVRTGAQALDFIAKRRYHLVLINRTLDGPMDGLSLLAALRRQTNPPPAMLISNYVDAQTSARQMGALPGFGRAQIEESIAVQRIAQALNTENAAISARPA